MEESREQSVARIANVRGLVQMLQSIKATAKQFFSHYISPGGRKHFGLQFAHLMDTIQVFASSGHELELRYPGPEMGLECRMSEGDEGCVINMYAHLSSIEMSMPRDMDDYWQHPSSHFMISGLILKEAIEDLEWTALGSNNSAIEIIIQRSPRRILLCGDGAGKLQVELATGDLTAFQCHEPEVRYRYKYKHLRTALCNIPQRDNVGVDSKMEMDSEGLLKVVHMVKLQNSSERDGFQPVPAYPESQADISRTGIVQFMMYAERDDADSQ